MSQEKFSLSIFKDILFADDDISSRDFIVRYLGILVILFLIPFMLNSFLDGEYLLGAADFIVIGLIASDIISVHKRGKVLINRGLLLVLICLMDYYSIHIQGVIGLFWAFPIAVSFYFVLPGRVALLTNIFFILGILPLSLSAVGAAITARVILTLILCSIVTLVFSYINKRQRMALQEQVVTDSLTGAFNRRFLNTRLAETIHKRNRHAHTATAIMLDIDHFKKINDKYGHDVGDNVLRIVVETIKARIRTADQIFRYGGEEFVVLLPDTNLDQGAMLARDITTLIASLNFIMGGPVTISCGVGELGMDEESIDWINRCDMALYQAKQLGRNRVCISESADNGDITIPRYAM